MPRPTTRATTLLRITGHVVIGVTLGAPSGVRAAGSMDIDDHCAVEKYDDLPPAEAASTAEACWREMGEPIHVFRAAQYWKGAGYWAHAIEAYAQYLAIVERDSRDKKRADMAANGKRESIAKTGEVRIVFDPQLRPDERVTLTAEFGDSERPPLRLAVSEGGTRLHLDPGTWRLRYERQGYLTSEVSVVAPQAGEAQDVELLAQVQEVEPEPDPEPRPVPAKAVPPPQKPWRGLLAGGSVALGVGLGVLAFAAGNRGYAEARTNEYNKDYDNAKCTAPNYCGDLYNDAVRARSRLPLELAGWVVSALAVSTGVVMMAISLRRRTLRHSQVAIDITPTFAGIGITSKF